MTNSEYAAWVQAIGSIAAIIGAAWIAIWQARKQHQSSIETLRLGQRLGRTELAKALLSLSKNCLRLLDGEIKQLGNREAVHNIADGRIHLDLNELRVVEGAVRDIPLLNLPHQLVSLTMMVNSTMRQFREHVELVLKVHREMDSYDFERFFNQLGAMRNSLSQICVEIEAEVKKWEGGA